MKAIHFVLAVAVVVVQAWPEGQPNCGLAGNWSDPEKKDRMAIATNEVGNFTQHQVTYNTSGKVFNGSGFLGDERAAAMTVKSPNESLLVTMLCYNKDLWVMQTPLLNSQRVVRVFTLTRDEPPPQPPLPVAQDAATSPTGHGAAPRYFLVNITIPKLSEDALSMNDSASYRKSVTDDAAPSQQRDVPAQDQVA
ncbi:hypothetical protein E2C01_088778 [Portunus trituberculatus]|uniref:Uncharacterized protein n=1 Tax=Portunus trituberculatus TaxID=210409 RepID=A0A5B7J732_PORTR|nr:hypothetical protein [Portunus trituberculatus]